MAHRLLLIRLGRNFILAGIVAGAYFVLGLLGLLFRFYGDPIGILMPSAGLALAAVLLFGNRILPGVIVGSFCVNAWAFDFKQTFLLFYSAGAFGSALTASVGAAMIRKKIGFPNALVDLRSIIRFMLLGGLISCMISASVVALAMLYSGIIAMQEIPAAWLSWWLADILGVLIFTPIILTFFAQPYPIWSRRRTTVGLPVTFGFILVFLLFCYMQAVDRKKYIEQLKENATLIAQALSNRIQFDTKVLYSVRNFLSVSKQVEPEVFSQFTLRTLSPFKEINAIGWFNEEENNSRLVLILNGNGSPKVFKKIHSEIRKKWMESPSFSESEILIADDESLQLVVPIIKEVDRRYAFTGVIVGNVWVENLLKAALKGLNTNNFSFVIEASSNSSAVLKTIYTSLADTNRPAYKTIEMPVANQTWRLKFYHEGVIEKPVDDRSIEWIAFDGLCVVGLLGMVLLHLTGRNFRSEALIEERASTLREMKASAESANNAKNQFLAKISHELRTPLNGISGFTQLLEKKPNLNAEDKNHVAIIKQCSDNLLKLINDILDISAIESQQLKTETGEFDYVSLLIDSLNIFKFRADEKGLKLISKNTCTVRNFIGDEKRIRQILANLIDNAIKYTNKGTVTVSTSYQEGCLIISVADTGCGISQNNMERIFTPFVQINSGNLSREGVGLGLPITKELVHLMNGELDVQSELSQGSTFTVRLPLPAAPDAEQTVLPEMQTPGSKYKEMHVLVVDDGEINLLFLACLLEQLGCKVDTARNGREALALIERNYYDLALIDINMPIMNGLELVQHLRSRQLLLYLVAVSAYADQEKIHEALRVGFDAYLTKPIEEKELVEIINISKKPEIVF